MDMQLEHETEGSVASSEDVFGFGGGIDQENSGEEDYHAASSGDPDAGAAGRPPEVHTCLYATPGKVWRRMRQGTDAHCGFLGRLAAARQKEEEEASMWLEGGPGQG